MTASLVRSALARLVGCAVVWWSVVEGGATVLFYGLAAVPLAVAVSFWVTGRGERGGHGGLRPLRLLALVGWLCTRTVGGGVDVARRALTVPSVDVDPHWETYETTLRSPSARVALALVMNLLPGTLSARLDGPHVAVHVISPDLEAAATLADLERRMRQAGAW